MIKKNVKKPSPPVKSERDKEKSVKQKTHLVKKPISITHAKHKPPTKVHAPPVHTVHSVPKKDKEQREQRGDLKEKDRFKDKLDKKFDRQKFEANKKRTDKHHIQRPPSAKAKPLPPRKHIIAKEHPPAVQKKKIPDEKSKVKHATVTPVSTAAKAHVKPTTPALLTKSHPAKEIVQIKDRPKEKDDKQLKKKDRPAPSVIITKSEPKIESKSSLPHPALVKDKIPVVAKKIVKGKSSSGVIETKVSDSAHLPKTKAELTKDEVIISEKPIVEGAIPKDTVAKDIATKKEKSKG